MNCHDVIGGTAAGRVHEALAAQEATTFCRHGTDAMEIRKAKIPRRLQHIRAGQQPVAAMAPCCGAPSPRFVRTSATLPWRNRPRAIFSAAARCIYTVRTWRRSAPSWCGRKPRAKAAGGLILQSLLDEAEDHGVGCVCLFTRIPDFFFRHGFRVVEDRTALPDKIYKDCQNCPRLYRCDEVAMARGQIPKVSILGTRIEAEQLVRLTG